MFTEEELDATLSWAEEIKANRIKKYEAEEQEYVEYEVIFD